MRSVQFFTVLNLPTKNNTNMNTSFLCYLRWFGVGASLSEGAAWRGPRGEGSSFTGDPGRYDML